MYNLFFWCYQPKLMCTFSNYDDCKKAHKTLKQKYPKSKIWFQPVDAINSYNEWLDRFNQGEIKEYADLRNK